MMMVKLSTGQYQFHYDGLLLHRANQYILQISIVADGIEYNSVVRTQFWHRYQQHIGEKVFTSQYIIVLRANH